MYKENLSNGEEALVITRREIEEQLKFHFDNEKRSREFLKLELSKPDEEQEQKMINYYAAQEKKAMGFKEAFDGLLFHFTGKMANIDEEGNLIK